VRATLLGLAMHQEHACISQISVLPIVKEQASMSDLLICTIFQALLLYHCRLKPGSRAGQQLGQRLGHHGQGWLSWSQAGRADVWQQQRQAALRGWKAQAAQGTFTQP